MSTLLKNVQRLMQGYFYIYFAIAVGQFVLFSFMRDIDFVFFVAASLWLAAIFFVADKLPHMKAFIVFSLFGLLLKWIWIVFVQTPAVSDYKLLYNTAQEILSGGREYLNNIYYRRFPYQLGFTTYQAIVLWLVNSVSFLKIVNACWCAVASAAVYGIAREVFNRDVARLALLLHVTLLPILILSSVLTNQHVAVAWLYIGIYVWLKFGGKTWWGPIVAGAAIAIGTMMRPIGIVVIAAIVVNELIRFIGSKAKWKAMLKTSLLRAAAAVIAYQGVLLLATMIFMQSGISPDGLKNNDPLWKFMVGLNTKANGGYSKGDERLVNHGYMDVDKRTALEKEIIIERLTSPRNMIKLPFVKIGKLWADYQPTWFTFPKVSGTYFNYLGWSVKYDDALDRYHRFERAVFYILAAFAFFGVIRSLRSRFNDHPQRLLILLLGAYTFIHVFVEVQSRYLYFLFVVIVVFAAVEMLNLRRGVRERFRFIARKP